MIILFIESKEDNMSKILNLYNVVIPAGIDFPLQRVVSVRSRCEIEINLMLHVNSIIL